MSEVMRDGEAEGGIRAAMDCLELWAHCALGDDLGARVALANPSSFVRLRVAHEGVIAAASLLQYWNKEWPEDSWMLKYLDALNSAAVHLIATSKRIDKSMLGRMTHSINGDHSLQDFGWKGSNGSRSRFDFHIYFSSRYVAEAPFCTLSWDTDPQRHEPESPIIRLCSVTSEARRGNSARESGWINQRVLHMFR